MWKILPTLSYQYKLQYKLYSQNFSAGHSIKTFLLIGAWTWIHFLADTSGFLMPFKLLLTHLCSILCPIPISTESGRYIWLLVVIQVRCCILPIQVFAVNNGGKIQKIPCLVQYSYSIWYVWSPLVVHILGWHCCRPSGLHPV